MEYKIRGISFGEEVELSWRDGKIAGHPQRKELLEAKARAFENFPVGSGPGGWPVSERDHLSDPYAAYVLMRRAIFQQVLEESGEIPKAPSLPTGMIP